MDIKDLKHKTNERVYIIPQVNKPRVLECTFVKYGYIISEISNLVYVYASCKGEDEFMYKIHNPYLISRTRGGAQLTVDYLNKQIKDAF